MVADALYMQQQIAAQHYAVIVIGTGPVGMRFVTQIARANPDVSVAVFGDEPWMPYNRVKLSALLTGDVREENLYMPVDAANHTNVSFHYNNRIVQIDRHTKQVVDSYGVRHGYQQLVLATGSRAFLPNIPGIGLKNVFTLRDLNDAQNLMNRIVRSRHTLIIGGGMLGLEAARAMHRFHTRVTVIEHSMWLMFRYIDQRAGSYLRRHIESLGIQVRTGERVLEVQGTDKVSGVLLGNGEALECDTIVVAAGISPNIQLIRQTGLHFGKGVRVNDQLQTNDPDIYAIGECAEHRKKTYGLVAPGYEQADVLAFNLSGGHARYTGSTATALLQVADYPVYSLGEVDMPVSSSHEIRFQDHKKGIYRKLIVVHGRLHGALGVGAWPGVQRLQEAVAKQRRVWPWQVKRFRKTGNLWQEDAACDVSAWPGSAVICDCTCVTRDQLGDAHRKGANQIDALMQVTGAASVCGRCRPLLANFISEQKTSSRKWSGPLAWILVSVLLGLSLGLLAYHGSEWQAHRELSVLLILCGLAISALLLRDVIKNAGK